MKLPLGVDLRPGMVLRVDSHEEIKAPYLRCTNAGWHISLRLKLPDGVRVCFLPPYTPELQPAERLWPLTNEGVGWTFRF